MSYYDYRASLEIVSRDHPFYALIMAAMRRADDRNIKKLQAAFPETWAELEKRYHSPAGMLPGERP